LCREWLPPKSTLLSSWTVGLMIREFSAGAVVLRQMKNRWWVAVIEPGREGEPAQRKGVVALPKGNVDAGEKPQETAVREVKEETGIHAEPITKLIDIRYVYTRMWSDQAKVFKVVSFFLMKYRSGQIDHLKDNMRHEVRRAFWLPLDEAAARLSYKGEKQVVEKALQYINRQAPTLAGRKT
jgi:8-oxo-dGTP diphosphatase